MNSRQLVASTLDSIVTRLEPVLNPWGFSFTANDVRGSHTGPYASGHFTRGTTRIGVSCRETLDNLYYQHAFIKQNACSRETETFTIGHDTLMEALGRSADCWLVVTNVSPDVVAARDGGDRIAAFAHDLTEIAAMVLSQPNEHFYEIMRRGRRDYSIA